MKKVLLVVIDALASRVVVPALDAGRLPTISALHDRGLLRTECTSIFPSITPAATASIVTGKYPCDHQIAGAFWYERDTDSVAYCGDDFWIILQRGMGEFVNDFLVRLNFDRLDAETLYQHVERKGLTAAAVNYMWFRGETTHEVDAPLLLSLFPGVTFPSQVQGPQVLTLGDFAKSNVPGRNERLQATGGLLRRYGFHDESTAEYLLHLATADPFPDFTLAYFPENDFASHSSGPEEAISVVEQVDQHLGEVIDRIGGIDRFLQDFAILIIGDHSQTDLISEPGDRGINLVQILAEYQLARAGQPWQADDDLMICPNMRACHIYLKNRSSSARDEVTRCLLDDSRIDQVIWRESSWAADPPLNHVDPAADKFHVVTSDRGELVFRLAVSSGRARDIYGTRWDWEGSLDCVSANVNDASEIVYDQYPNALERIATGFCDLTPDLWITAKPGYEFTIEETTAHPGGSHGALNQDDSTVPFIAAGLPQDVHVPLSLRIVDIAPLCLQILGLDDEAAEIINNRVAGRPSLP